MEPKKTPPQENKKIVVAVNIDEQSLKMADTMIAVVEAESRSDYIRRLIRADHRRYIRRQQAKATV